MIDRVTKLDGEERLKDGTVLIGGVREGERQRESFGLVGIAASVAAQRSKLLPDE